MSLCVQPPPPPQVRPSVRLTSLHSLLSGWFVSKNRHGPPTPETNQRKKERKKDEEKGRMEWNGKGVGACAVASSPTNPRQLHANEREGEKRGETNCQMGGESSIQTSNSKHHPTQPPRTRPMACAHSTSFEYATAQSSRKSKSK